MVGYSFLKWRLQWYYDEQQLWSASRQRRLINCYVYLFEQLCPIYDKLPGNIYRNAGHE